MSATLDAITETEIKALVSFLHAGLQYESRISRIMRTVSECLHFEGKYYNSTKGKTLNRYISKAAASLIETSSKGEFAKGTILEHPNPLEKIYQQLLTTEKIDDSDIVAALCEYRLITVTKKENGALKHKGWKDPMERYSNANIEVGFVENIVFGTRPTWSPVPLKSALFSEATTPRPTD